MEEEQSGKLNNMTKKPVECNNRTPVILAASSSLVTLSSRVVCE
jgi:hypothetical protein